MRSSDTTSNTLHSDVAQPHLQQRIPIPVWIMGLVMCLMNISFTMVYSLTPTYLFTVVGLSAGMVGMMDTIAEGVSYAAKLCSGLFSDYFRRRKVIVVIGYAMMVFSRPVIAAYTNLFAVASSRFVERVGNGIQATPRDALISDVAPANRKGECFGLMRSIGIIGSFIGSLIGGGLMYYTDKDYKLIFWLATIPAIIAFCLLVFKIKEPEEHLHPRDNKPRHPLHFSDIPRLSNTYWALMGVVVIFMFSRVSETFMTLHACKNFGLDEANSPAILILYNLTYCLSAYPIGRLSDYIGRYTLLALSIGMMIISGLVLWQSTSLSQVFVGVAFWGLQMGMTQSLFMALIADLAPEDLRGTAFGFYYLISAVSTVICGFVAHYVTETFDLATLYLTVSTVALVSLILTVLISPRQNLTQRPREV